MLIYAHRGDHRLHAENTIAAFEAAIANGADGIETDLRHTADGIVAVFHDHAVNGVPVAELTHSELCQRADVDVPTITDLLSLSTRTAWNLEIKTYAAWRLARRSVSEWMEDALITSFIHPVAERAAQEGWTAGLLIAHQPARRETWRPTQRLTTMIQDWKVAIPAGAAGIRRAGWRYGVYGMAGNTEHNTAARDLRPDIMITDDIDAARRARASQCMTKDDYVP